MNLNKVSTKVSARRVPSSRNSVQFSWKIYWGHPPRMWPKKLYPAWFLHKAASVFCLKLRTIASKTTFKEWQTWTITLVIVKTLSPKLVDKTILTWVFHSKTAPVVPPPATWWEPGRITNSKTTCKLNCYTKAWTIRDQNRGWRVRRWTRESKEVSPENIRTKAQTANTTKWAVNTSSSSTTDTRATLAQRECLPSPATRWERNDPSQLNKEWISKTKLL